MNLAQEQIDSYRSILSQARGAESPHPIGNRFPWHAKIAVKELLAYAHTLSANGEKSEVRLASDSFSDFVYNQEACESVRAILNAGGNVRAIFIGNELPNDSLLVSTLLEFNQVKPLGMKSPGSAFQHFCVVNDSAFRLEKGHDQYDPNDVSDFYPVVASTICFNDRKIGQALESAFEKFWSVAS